MLEFKFKNHLIYTVPENGELLIAITRMLLLGGVVQTIKLYKPLNSSYADVMQYITNVVKLDDEVFSMVCEHKRDEN